MSFSSSSKSKRKTNALHLGVQELKCKNGCGYYGNPEWQGYCSQCHRDLHLKTKHDSKHSSKKLTRSSSDAQDSSLSQAFSKFEEKKKQQSEKRTKTIKSIIKRGHTLKESSSHSPWREHRLRNEANYLGSEFSDFLKTLPEDASSDVYKQIDAQMTRMHKYIEKSIDERSELMQDFYQHMSNRCETHIFYQDVSPELAEKLMDLIEKTLMTSLYRSVFQQISSEHEEKDLALQKRIRSLNWITSQHLETDINENHPEVRDLIDKAITDIIEMDSKRAPQEKLNCIVNCSKNIFNILLLCRGSPASADEFLPAMVYIVLKGNPPLLQSNIKFVTNYSIPTRLMSGEGGYYFTNLCCAVAFIENLTAESLSLSKEEFEKYMSGEAVPPGGTEQSPPLCEGLRLFYQNLATLNDLGEKQEKLMAEVLSLQVDMDKFNENIVKTSQTTSDNLLNDTPYIIPSDIDPSLIPALLSTRVVQESPKDEILVEIDYESIPAAEQHEILKSCADTIGQDIISSCTGDHDPLAEFSTISDTEASIALPPIVPLKLDVCSLPPKPTNVVPPLQNDPAFLDLFSASPQSPLSLISNVHPSQYPPNQSLSIIKDLDYPTEVFLENSPVEDVQDGTNKIYSELGYEPLKIGSTNELEIPFTQTFQPFQDPLLPETGSPEDNLCLPPPLQPVVLQSCTSNDPQDNTSTSNCERTLHYANS